MTQPIVPPLNPTTATKLARVDHLFAGDTLVIGSATTLGKFYQVTEHGCTCRAGDFSYLKCWHVDVRRYLIASMTQVETLEPVTAGPQTPEELDALADARQLRDALAEMDAPKQYRVSDAEMAALDAYFN